MAARPWCRASWNSRSASRTDGLEANADVVLYAAFEDKAALAAYQAHPHHQAVGAQIAQMRQSRVVVDYET